MFACDSLVLFVTRRRHMIAAKICANITSLVQIESNIVQLNGSYLFHLTLTAATCLAVTELGPCYSALQYETQVEAAEGKSETCKKYLEEVLSKCAQKNTSQGIDSCKQRCSKYTFNKYFWVLLDVLSKQWRKTVRKARTEAAMMRIKI